MFTFASAPLVKCRPRCCKVYGLAVVGSRIERCWVYRFRELYVRHGIYARRGWRILEQTGVRAETVKHDGGGCALLRGPVDLAFRTCYPVGSTISPRIPTSMKRSKLS